MPNPPPRALQDPVLCRAPGLFRSLIPGCRNTALKVDYRPSSGRVSYRFRTPTLLGCDDLRVLQGIVALANRASCAIRPDKMSDDVRSLRDELHLKRDARQATVVLVETSLVAIGHSAGYAASRGGPISAHLRRSLDRLASVAMIRCYKSGVDGSRLIAWDKNGRGHSKVRIALNPTLSDCAIGAPPFAQIEMTESRKLQGDVARLLHQRLCAWINANQTKAVRIETLLAYPGWDAELTTSELADAALRQRRRTIKAAIQVLKSVGWRIDRDMAGMYKVQRPAPGKLRMDPSSTFVLEPSNDQYGSLSPDMDPTPMVAHP